MTHQTLAHHPRRGCNGTHAELVPSIALDPQNEFLSGAILRAHVQAEAHHPGFSLLVLVFGMWGLGVRATVVA